MFFKDLSLFVSFLFPSFHSLVFRVSKALSFLEMELSEKVLNVHASKACKRDDDDSDDDDAFLSSIIDHRSSFIIMLFYSFFKTLVGKQITVELKNDLEIRGTLVSVDQYLNIKLESVSVVDEEKYPHMKSIRDCFVRGSVVRYVQPPEESVDVDILHDATRREARSAV